MVCRFYIANSLQGIPQNKYMVKSLYETLYPEQIEIDTRSGDEIAAEVIKNAGLSFGG